MLVLSRKAEESVFVGEISIKVLSIKGNRVRLGITADPSVKIVRSEKAATKGADCE